jgi:hypothetical protein
MSNVVYINKTKVCENSDYYQVNNHKYHIYKVSSCIPAYPWRISYNDEEASSMFMNNYNAENFMISKLAELNEFKDKVFSIKAQSELVSIITCECGKEKHNFFKHSSWCPKAS